MLFWVIVYQFPAFFEPGNYSSYSLFLKLSTCTNLERLKRSDIWPTFSPPCGSDPNMFQPTKNQFYKKKIIELTFDIRINSYCCAGVIAPSLYYLCLMTELFCLRTTWLVMMKDQRKIKTYSILKYSIVMDCQ